MRHKLRTLLVLIALIAVFVGAWTYVNRRTLTRQWRCYRVSSAESFEQAQEEIAWFENGADRHERLAELMRKWGTGNRQFDLYLARHLHEPACGDPLREAFSEELGRRDELLPRWAHYWSYSSAEEPDEQIDSILRHLDALLRTPTTEQIPWREVLNLQALFQLAGCPERARDLSPSNWQATYRAWLEVRPNNLPHIARPERPFAE